VAKCDALAVKLEPRIEQYLQQMIRTGLYGPTTEDVARDLILEGLRRAVTSKLIPIPAV